MNVGEVIAELQKFAPELNCYVLDKDGTSQIVKSIELMGHLDLPDGVDIPPDVAILPWIEGE